MKRRAIEVRIGDEWAFLTNYGFIVRKVTDVGDGRVWYRSFGDPYEKECLAATFQRWVKRAELHFATDWTGRDSGATSKESPNGN